MQAQGNLQFPDYVMISGYFVLMLIIGVYFYRSMRGIKDYFSGGNNIPWWLSGVSFYMSSFSVAAFIMYPSLCYSYGWVGVTLLWVAAPATLFSSVFLARKWRRARIDSPVEYLELRFSPALRQLFTWQGLPLKVIDDGIKLCAIGKFISISLGFDMIWSILGAGGIMLLYTFMGGLWAVAVTDFVQFIVLSAAILIMLPLSILRAGGVAAIVDNAPEGFFNLTVPEYGWGYVAFLVIMYTLAWSSVNWPLIQRYYCVPRERDAVKVGLTVIVLYIVGPPLMFLPAIAATRILPGLADPETVYPMLCNTLLPAGMLGLVVAAMFAATMSMLSSDYNVCANVLTNDVYRRLLRANASQRELVTVGRLFTLLVGALALGAALYIALNAESNLFHRMVTLFSVATAPVAIPMILGLLSKRATASSALWSFLCGFAAAGGLFALSLYTESFTLFGIQWTPETKTLSFLKHGVVVNEVLWFSVSAAITLLVMIGRTLQRPMQLAEKERVYAFLDRLTVPIGMLPEDKQAAESASAVSPFRIVGISLVAIALLMLFILPWSGAWITAALNGIISALLLLVGLLMAWPRKRRVIPPATLDLP